LSQFEWQGVYSSSNLSWDNHQLKVGWGFVRNSYDGEHNSAVEVCGAQACWRAHWLHTPGDLVHQREYTSFVDRTIHPKLT
jgi:hypothetical protein